MPLTMTEGIRQRLPSVATSEISVGHFLVNAGLQWHSMLYCLVLTRFTHEQVTKKCIYQSDLTVVSFACNRSSGSSRNTFPRVT